MRGKLTQQLGASSSTSANPVGFLPRPGALRFLDDNGVYQCANPRDPLYSTVSMIASEYYSEGEWKPILDPSME